MSHLFIAFVCIIGVCSVVCFYTIMTGINDIHYHNYKSKKHKEKIKSNCYIAICTLLIFASITAMLIWCLSSDGGIR